VRSGPVTFSVGVVAPARAEGGRARPSAVATVLDVTCANVLLDRFAGGVRSRRSVVALAALSAMALGACGGGDDDESAASTTAPITQAPITQAPVTLPPVTLPPATSPPTGPVPVSYVTEGATVMVANASRIDGGAGRMTERLAAVGYQMVAAGNYSLGQLDVSKVYYDPANPQARAVADSLKAALGGGAIEVLELPAPAPTDTADVGGAGVLVAMGNDTADKTLDQLQGITPPPTSAPADTSAPPTT
jgi:hypothetical protein